MLKPLISILSQIISASLIFGIVWSLGGTITTWQYWAVFILLVIFGVASTTVFELLGK